MIPEDIRQKLAAITPPAAEGADKFLFNAEIDPLETIPQLTLLGGIPTLTSREIASSPLGIGLETLDRDTFDPNELYPLLGASGVKHARCQTGWKKCEKEPGKYDFAWLDAIADGLIAVGIEPWFDLVFGHPVYTPAPHYAAMVEAAEREGRRPAGQPRGWVGESPYLHGPEAMEAWKRYVKAICLDFKGRVRTWEIWNEPDGFTFWRCRGENSPKGADGRAADYTEFVRITAAVIREAIPDAQVVGSVAATASAYIRGLGKAGLADVIDIFAYHYYSPVPEHYLRERVAHIRANLRRSDGRPLRIYQGESGRATGKSAHFGFPSQLSQARFMARRFLADFICGAELSSFFTSSDLCCYYGDGSDQYCGVWDARNKKTKLAYRTLQAMTWLFDGLKPAPEYMALFQPGSHFQVGSWQFFNGVTAAFRRKGIPLFAVWIPEHVDLSMPLLSGRLLCTTEEKTPMPDPVIIDPVRGRVWDASKFITRHADGWYEGVEDFFPFPVTNSPLIVTDAAVFRS